MTTNRRRAAPSAGARRRYAVIVLAALLLVDLVLLLLFLRWAYVTHHRLADSLLLGRDWFSLNEGGLADIWGYSKLAVATGLIAAVARTDRGTGFYRALAMLMLVMLLSDAFQVHERLNAWGSALAGRTGRCNWIRSSRARSRPGRSARWRLRTNDSSRARG